ncbi:serine-rich adhesin for platelets [Paralichthys olivaceus]|uniref:serine-rich adhesin for platelets n=1 Tax=Paralichthys olivaceus TaxID=8255 RepID=UPI003751BD58
MARPGRPVSENYQPICCSVSQSGSYSSETGIMGPEDDNELAPIFSISKSSMDVVMSAGPSHKRDPTWTRMHLRRSSSANIHSEHSAVMLQQLHPHMWQHINSHQLALSTQNVSVHSPSLLSERRIGSMQRWSGCSGSTHSRSSTPETIVWRGGTSRPSSLTQEVYYAATPDSLSKLSSAPTTPSPFTSPLDTPTLSPIGLFNSASTVTLNANQQEDALVSPPASSSPSSPPQAHNSSPLPSNSPNLLLSDTKDESLLEDNLLSFQLPSQKPSSVSLAEGNADGECLGDDIVKELQSPGGPQLSEGGGEAEKMFNYLSPPGEEPESGSGQASVCQLELSRQLWETCPTRGGWRSPLVSSLSDSGLGDCCKCNLISRVGVTKGPRVEAFREEGTMTSPPQLVDAEVQTITPMGSLWNLKRNTFTSNMGSHSLLGSPPGSRLNLKSSVGSNSNLVSPSSSMFPISSEDDEEERQGDDPRWDITSASSHDMERRRSCLKIQGEERDELGRRSSMKQVQWDEDGMTWDVHGASVDPEVLSTAIQKHLELQNSPLPQRRSSKKRKAPKPPLISSVLKAMAPDLNPNVIMSTTRTVEGESEETLEEEEEERKTGGAKKEEAAEVPRRISRAEGEYMRDEEEEVYGEVGLAQRKSPSVVSTLSHKRSVIRSLRRPGWCGGGSRKTDN